MEIFRKPVKKRLISINCQVFLPIVMYKNIYTVRELNLIFLGPACSKSLLNEVMAKAKQFLALNL